MVLFNSNSKVIKSDSTGHNILETSVRAPLIFPVGKISHGFAKGDWNDLFSVELQVPMTSVEGHIHLSTYKHAGYWHVANTPFLGSRWISCFLVSISLLYYPL